MSEASRTPAQHEKMENAKYFTQEILFIGKYILHLQSFPMEINLNDIIIYKE